MVRSTRHRKTDMRATNGQMFTDFIETPKEYVLVNPTDETIEFSYDGETRRVPAYNVVVKPHPKFDDVPHSALDENGEYIPGTLVVKDIFGALNEALGGSERLWNAAEAIKHCLGIDTKTGAASGKFSERGLTVGPRSYTRSVIDGLKTTGRGRYEIWRINDAEETMRAHESKNAVRQRLGMPEVAGDESYRKAALLVNMANKRGEKLMQESFDVSFSEDHTEKQGAVTSLADGVDALSFEDKKALFEKLMEGTDVNKLSERYYVRPLKDGEKPKKAKDVPAEA